MRWHRAVAAVACVVGGGCASVGQHPLPAHRMRGDFVYLADAASFTDCRTGERVPVAMEGDYVALERAYLSARSAPIAPLMVTVSGATEERPSMEGPSPVRTLVVTAFEGVWPHETCTAEPVELGRVQWTLAEIGGDRGAIADMELVPNVRFDTSDGSMAGFAGCNRVSGSFTRHERELRLGPLATTRMACATGMDLEGQVLQLLTETNAFEVFGSTLVLYDGHRRLARFRADIPR